MMAYLLALADADQHHSRLSDFEAWHEVCVLLATRGRRVPGVLTLELPFGTTIHDSQRVVIPPQLTWQKVASQVWMKIKIIVTRKLAEFTIRLVQKIKSCQLELTLLPARAADTIRNKE